MLVVRITANEKLYCLSGSLTHSLTHSPPTAYDNPFYSPYCGFLLWLAKCSIDPPSWGTRSEGSHIYHTLRGARRMLHRLSLFHRKTININLKNACVWYKSTPDCRRGGVGGFRPDLLSFPQAVELESRSSVGFADIWRKKSPPSAKAHLQISVTSAGLVL